jgi:hypothetical protein
MKDVFSGRDFRPLFTNFSGHLEKAGHQVLARALFEKIEQEWTSLGLQGAKVTVAESPRGSPVKGPKAQSAAPAP